MKRSIAMVSVLVMLVSLLTSYMPSASAAGASGFFFDYTYGYTQTDANKPNPNTNTRVSYDSTQEALKITTAGKRADEANGQKIGQMIWLPENKNTNVSIEDYPYFAIKIKTADIAVTEVSMQMSARSGYSSSFGSILQPLEGYDSYEVGKWVLYICDGNSVLNNSSYYGDGRWYGNLISITNNKDLADGKVHDLAWVQWAGVFASVEDAQAMFDQTTPPQDNIDGASDFFFEYSTGADIYPAYNVWIESPYNTAEGNSALAHDAAAQALSVSTKDGYKAKDAIGKLHFWPGEEVADTISTDDYPYFAIKVKMIKNDAVPTSSAQIRADNGTLLTVKTVSARDEHPTQKHGYAWTPFEDEWQLMIFSAKSQPSVAYWNGFSVSLIDHTYEADASLWDGKAEEIAHVAWAGAFASIADAQKHFDNTTATTSSVAVDKGNTAFHFALPLESEFYHDYDPNGIRPIGNSQMTYDVAENAYKISTVDSANVANIGGLSLQIDSNRGTYADPTRNSVKAYPVVAVKIKLARKDLGAMPTALGAFDNGFGEVCWQYRDTANTSDWQLLVYDTRRTNGQWNGLQINGLTANTNVLKQGETVDLGWIQWVATFASVQDAEAYFDKTSGNGDAVECSTAAIRTKLSADDTQGLRFYQTLKTKLVGDKETVLYNGKAVQVLSVSVLTAPLNALTAVGKTADDLNADLVGKLSKVTETAVTSCFSRDQNGDRITYRFAATCDTVSQQDKATDICARTRLRCQTEDGTMVDVYGKVQITNVKEMYGVVDNARFDSATKAWMAGYSPSMFLDIQDASSLNKINKHANSSYQYKVVDGVSSVLVSPLSDGVMEGGTIGWSASPHVSVEQFPVVAMRVKLKNPNVDFGRFYWRTEESERMYYVVQDYGSRINWMQAIGDFKMTYQPTDDWQIIYVDMSEVHNPYFIGKWTAMMCNMLPIYGTDITTDDGVYIDWMGGFGSVEDLYAFAGEPCPEQTPEQPLPESEQFAKDNAWAINNTLSSEMTKIPTETVVINGYDPKVDIYSFQHHPSLTYFKGKWYAGYSNGIKDEDCPGQKMVYSTSTDFYNWTEPQDIVPIGSTLYRTTNELPEMAELNAKGVVSTQVIGGFSTVGDTLCFYYSVCEFYPESFDKNGNFRGYDVSKFRIQRQYGIFSTDGVTWSAPMAVSSINRYSTFQQSPYGSKKYYSICGFRIHYSSTDALNPRTRIPSSVMSNDQIVASRERCPGSLTETSYYQGPDGVLHLMCRSDTGYIWSATSTDEGLSWSEFYPTNFVSASTMFTHIMLPDGRIAWVGSPYYDVRWPLTLYISEDGYNFDTAYILQDEVYEMQQDGWAKGGAFAYPQLAVRDGYLYVMYTKQKEVVEICRVKLSDI